VNHASYGIRIALILLLWPVEEEVLMLIIFTKKLFIIFNREAMMTSLSLLMKFFDFRTS